MLEKTQVEEGHLVWTSTSARAGFLWAVLRPHAVQRRAATSKFHVIVCGQRNCSDLPLGSLFSYNLPNLFGTMIPHPWHGTVYPRRGGCWRSSERLEVLS